MTEKRYFKKEWEEEYYIFDSTHISEERIDEWIEYDYNVFAEAMQGDEVVNTLNKQEQEIQRQKLVIAQVIDSIIEDARIQLNVEFLELADNFETLEEFKTEIQENLKNNSYGVNELN